jgi:Neutral/alkaline non-lysosomal ceramidase, N-terminal
VTARLCSEQSGPRAAVSLTGATVDITPQVPTPLMAQRSAERLKIHSRLEANVIVLRSVKGAPLVIVQLDLLFAGQTLRERLIDKLAAPIGRGILDPQRIFLFASHSHYTPSTDCTLDFGAVTDSYVEMIAEKIANSIESACAHDGERLSHIEVARNSIGGTVNRRSKRWRLVNKKPTRIIVQQPNPSGATDATVTVLKFVTANGETATAVWHATCHPTSFPDLKTVSAEFPGTVRFALRQRLGRTIPILFLRGFAGDIRPWIRASSVSLTQRLRELLEGGPVWTRVTQELWEAWAQERASEVVKLIEHPAIASFEPEAEATRLVRPISTILDGASPSVDLGLARIVLGKGDRDDLSIVAMSAETLVGYVAHVRNRFGPFALATGYLDRVFGYLPTAIDLAAGGYEANDSLARFRISGRLRVDVERIVCAWLDELHATRGPDRVA